MKHLRYRNTTSLLLPIDTVWKPDIVIIASAESGVSLDYGVATVRYFPTGPAFLWNPMSLVSVSCRINIEFYPFDTQECPVWFILTGYFSTEAQLHAVNKEAPLKYHFDNGMWELIMSEARAEYGVMYGVNLKNETNAIFRYRHCYHTYNIAEPYEFNGFPLAP